MSMHWKVFCVAGEASGDVIGARMMRALQLECLQRGERVEFFGVGGRQMRAYIAPDNVLFHRERLSVMGMGWPLLAALPKLWIAKRAVVRDIHRKKPHAVILIDSKAFNTRVARETQGLRGSTAIVQYVAPSIWAYNDSSTAKSTNYLSLFDTVLLLFPFELDAWKQLLADRVARSKLAVVGSPAAELELHARSKDAAGLDKRQQGHVSVFLGSREAEVLRVGPAIAAGVLRSSRVRSATFVAADGIEQLVHNVVYRAKTSSSSSARISVQIVSQMEHNAEKGGADLARSVMRTSALCVATSGTVVLEAALSGTPVICAYDADWLTRLAIRRRVRLRFASIPNILANRDIIPELLFERCRPENVSHLVDSYLDETSSAAADQKRALTNLLSDVLPHESSSALSAAMLPSELAARLILDKMRAIHGAQRPQKSAS